MRTNRLFMAWRGGDSVISRRLGLLILAAIVLLMLANGLLT